jgi:hypothetical protein
MNIDEIIQKRKTQKVLATTPYPVAENLENTSLLINELLALAASAPYHKKCNSIHYVDKELNSCLPWRTYVLDSLNCRALANLLEVKNIKSGKIKDMLFAADTLFLVTWLPEPIEQYTSESNVLFNGNLQNMEHIAAASAAIQNILIGATARDIPNYWSSGGILRKDNLKDIINIPSEQILLGAIFLFPSEIDSSNTTIKPGANRDLGKETSSWSKWITV